MPTPDEEERAVERAIRTSWPTLDRAAASTLAQAMVASGNIDGLLAVFPWQQWAAQLGGSANAFQEAVGGAVESELHAIGVAQVMGAFDHIDAIAVRYAQNMSARLIKALSDSQRGSMRAVMGEALSGRYTVDQAARMIRDTVGLHPAWAQAVVTRRTKMFSDLLREGKSEAQAGILADRRAIAYRNRLVRVRAETIARTEIQTAANLGRFASWAEAIGSGNVSAQSQKEWSASPGACHICVGLSGQTVRWDQPYSNGALVPPAHPRCRCTSVLIPPPRGTSMMGLDAQPIDWLSAAQPSAAELLGSGSAGDAWAAAGAAADVAMDFEQTDFTGSEEDASGFETGSAGRAGFATEEDEEGQGV